MKNRKVIFAAVGLFLVLIVTVVGVVLAISKQKSIAANSCDIPKIELSLKDTNFEEISSGSKNVKYQGNEARICDTHENYDYTEVEVKGRGNSTWGMPKKPLQIKFDQKVDLLGLGKARKWVLIADYFDASHLRNDTALYLAKMLDAERALTGKYVELVIDGEYQGLYYLTHRVEISKSVVDLRDPKGVLVELDNLHGLDNGCYWTTSSNCLTVKDIISEDLEPEIMQEFLADFDALEIAAKEKDYQTVEKLIDVESFAKYFLLSEFTVNPDAYSSSWFMYRDGEDDKIHAGPGWDFDYALGNKSWVWTTTEEFYSPENDMIREIDAMGGKFVLDGEVIEKEADSKTSKLVYYLMKIPEFREEVRRIYQEKLAGRKAELLMHMRWQVGKIYTAILRDYQKWNRGDFAEEVEYLMDWVSRRYDHFEKTYGDNKHNYDIMVTEI